jgi:ATP-dependent DNA ligase
VIDGEIVALDVSGKPVFTMLQNGVAYDWRQAYRT